MTPDKKRVETKIIIIIIIIINFINGFWYGSLSIFYEKTDEEAKSFFAWMQIRNLLLDIENKENENRGNPCSSICKLGDEFLIVELQPAVVHISILSIRAQVDQIEGFFFV